MNTLLIHSLIALMLQQHCCYDELHLKKGKKLHFILTSEKLQPHILNQSLSLLQQRTLTALLAFLKNNMNLMRIQILIKTKKMGMNAGV